MEDRRALMRMIRGTRTLPTLPAIVDRLETLSQSPRTTPREMARVIASDQVLTMKLLRLVNSPFYGFAREVSTVSGALILLGVNVVKSLIISASIFEMMERHVVGLWQHSLATAVAASVISERLGLADREEISTAALLHDIGKVVIHLYLQEDDERLVALHEELSQVPAHEAEKRMLGIDHAEIGEWLCKRWQLPASLVEPVACHHEVARSVAWRRHTAVVHLADVLVKARGYGVMDPEPVPRIQEAASDALRLGDRELEAIIAGLEDRLIEIRSFNMEMLNGD